MNFKLQWENKLSDTLPLDKESYLLVNNLFTNWDHD